MSSFLFGLLVGFGGGVCIGAYIAWFRCKQPGWVTRRAAKLGLRDRVP